MIDDDILLQNSCRLNWLIWFKFSVTEEPMNLIHIQKSVPGICEYFDSCQNFFIVSSFHFGALTLTVGRQERYMACIKNLTSSPQSLDSPLSIWPHLFRGAGHEKRRGEQLKWSLTFRLYIGSFPCAQLPGPVHTARLGRVFFVYLA